MGLFTLTRFSHSYVFCGVFDVGFTSSMSAGMLSISGRKARIRKPN